MQWDEKYRRRDSLYFNKVVRVGLISKIMLKPTPEEVKEVKGRAWRKRTGRQDAD